ncbi:hypothetical protein V2G26_014182 [Clonostachys chloroleuca]
MFQTMFDVICLRWHGQSQHDITSVTPSYYICFSPSGLIGSRSFPLCFLFLSRPSSFPSNEGKSKEGKKRHLSWYFLTSTSLAEQPPPPPTSEPQDSLGQQLLPRVFRVNSFIHDIDLTC